MSPADLKCPVVNEMDIVDMFTRLIFDPESKLDDTEALIIELLGQVDSSLVAAPRRDISEYLRSMEVDEMIRVVKTLKPLMEQHTRVFTSKSSPKHPSLSH